MILNPFETINRRLGNIEELLLSLKNPESDRLALKLSNSKQYVYGLPGLAKLANCSISKAFKLKNSGDIPYSQSGRKLIFDVEAVLDALKNKPENIRLDTETASNNKRLKYA